MNKASPISATARARLRRRYLEVIVAVLLTAAAAATLIWSLKPSFATTASLLQLKP
jgi:hypothetical protein